MNQPIKRPPEAKLSAAELVVLKRVIATMPKVAADRRDMLSGLYSWRLLRLGRCPSHWALPISSTDAVLATYLERVFAPAGASSVTAARLASIPRSGGTARFCDPESWKFWLDPFTTKLPNGPLEDSPGASILGPLAITGRHKGYIPEALRARLQSELGVLVAALPPQEARRVTSVSLGIDVQAPLAAHAVRKKRIIVLSEALLRYALLRAIGAQEAAIASVRQRFLHGQFKPTEAARLIDRIATRTQQNMMESLRFIMAHELAHLYVPTLDENEADCWATARLGTQSKSTNIGLFREVKAALDNDVPVYWNGLSAPAIQKRFALVALWTSAQSKGADIAYVCREAFEVEGGNRHGNAWQ